MTQYGYCNICLISVLYGTEALMDFILKVIRIIIYVHIVIGKLKYLNIKNEENSKRCKNYTNTIKGGFKNET